VLGTTIGNYQITALLGEGGMGKVYVAQHPTLARKSAIKVLHPEQARDPVALSRFFNEAKAADAIRHPNIVEIYDYGTLPDGAPYIAMEYLEGETLAERLARGPLTVGETLDVIAQAASALGAAHAKEVLHRDLKPDNIFLVADPARPGHVRVKIVDFGIAKLQVDLSESSLRTRTGALIGTPLYMSPEQCLGVREIGPPSDLYSLGVMAYELLCGRPPFEAEAVGALINMHVNEPALLPRKLNPRLPRALEAILVKALAKVPENRYPRMEELQAELEKLRAQLERTDPQALASTPEKRPSHPLEAVTAMASTITGAARSTGAPRPAGRRVLWLLALGTGVALLLVLSQRHPAPPPAPAVPVVAAPVVPPPVVPAAPATVTLQLESSPPGATVRVGSAPAGTTPTTFTTRAGKEPVAVTFSMDGFRNEVIRAIPSNDLEVFGQLEPLKRKGGKKTPAPPPPPDDIKSER
jgi:serine/threonine-protein kinase